MSNTVRRPHSSVASVVCCILAVLWLVLPYGQCRDLPTNDGGEGQAQAHWYPYQRTLNELNVRTLHLRTEYRQDRGRLNSPRFQAQSLRLNRDWVGLLRRLAQRDDIPARFDIDSGILNMLFERERALVERYRRMAGGGGWPAQVHEFRQFEQDWTRFVVRQQERIDHGIYRNLRDRVQFFDPNYDG